MTETVQRLVDWSLCDVRRFSSLNTALTALRYNRVAMDVAGGEHRQRRHRGLRPPPRRGRGRRRPHAAGHVVALRRGRRRRPGHRCRPDDRRAARRARPSRARQPDLPRHPPGHPRAGRDRGRRARRLRRRRRDRGLPHCLARPRTTRAATPPAPRCCPAPAASCDAIRVQARNVDSEAGRPAVHLLNDVTEVNTVASDLAATNTSHRGGQPQRHRRRRPARQARPARDAALRAHRRARPRCAPTAASTSPSTAYRSSPAARPAPSPSPPASPPTATATATPITFAIVDATGTTTVPAGMVGEIGGVTDLLTTTLPAYLTGLERRRQGAGRRGQHPAPGRVRRGRYAGHGVLQLRPHRRARLPVRRDHRPRPGGRLAVPGGGLDVGNATRSPPDRCRGRLPAAGQRLRHRGRLGRAGGPRTSRC